MILNQRLNINHLCINTYLNSTYGDFRSVSLDRGNNISLEKDAYGGSEASHWQRA